MILIWRTLRKNSKQCDHTRITSPKCQVPAWTYFFIVPRARVIWRMPGLLLPAREVVVVRKMGKLGFSSRLPEHQLDIYTHL